MKLIGRLVGAAASSLRGRRTRAGTREIDIEISHDVEWAHYRRERVPLCIATKHLRS
jgi:hypothetical protein